jgi:hypothetical protein
VWIDKPPEEPEPIPGAILNSGRRRGSQGVTPSLKVTARNSKTLHYQLQLQHF